MRIGWLDGHWGSLKELKVPLADRSLNYGDGIFETILISNGKAQLLRHHFNRWQNSALKLGMAQPPKEEIINQLINEGIKKCSLENSNGAIRLNWSRGYIATRGINFPIKKADPSNHRFWLEINNLEPCFKPVSTMISLHEKRNAESNLNLHKTFAYGQSIQARKEAQEAGFDEALLQSTSGEICCGAVANLIIKRNNKFLTPRLESGCLPGIMRQQGLNKGLIEEVELEPTPHENDKWLLVNSLSCKPIFRVNNTSLQIDENSKKFWFSLYNL